MDPWKAVEEVWPQCQRAAWDYGKQWRKLSVARQRMMAARLKDHEGDSPLILVHAIHGYVLLRRPSNGEFNSQFDWFKFCTPETIYQAGKFPQYVEAFLEEEKLQKKINEPEYEVTNSELQQLDEYLEGVEGDS